MNNKNFFGYDEKSYQIEQEVLSILICNDFLIKEVKDINPNIFKVTMHKLIFTTMLFLYNKNGKFTFIDLANYNKDMSNLIDYMLKLQDAYVSSKNLHYYISELEEIDRICLTENKLMELKDGAITFDEMLSFMKQIQGFDKEESDGNLLSANEIFDLVTTDATKIKFNNMNFIQSRVGFIERTLNILSARTSVGKSAFALNILNDLASNYKCLYFNMEMTERELYQRLCSINSEIKIEDLHKAKSNQNLCNRLNQAINIVKSKRIRLYNGSKTLNGIRKLIARHSKEEHIIVFVDYIGYVYTEKKQNDRERIGEAVRELQIMTKDMNCTIFILAQLNREGTDTPTLTHLKDSGELEQTGHAILFLHNPSSDISEQKPIYDLIVAKNRSGRLGKMQIEFDKPIQKFREVIYK